VNRNYTITQLDSVCKELLACTDKKIFLFYAEMGVGKTTLIKTLLKLLGVNETVNSPTFSLVNEYRDAQNTTVYHFDFYRINNEEEALDMGVEEYFDQNAYCFVEWPENIENLLPLEAVSVFLTQLEDKSRNIRVVI